MMGRMVSSDSGTEDAVEVASGIWVPEGLTVGFTSERGGWHCDLHVKVYSRPSGRGASAVVDAIQTTDRNEGLAGDRLREIPVKQVVGDALRSAIWASDGHGEARRYSQIIAFPPNLLSEWPNGDVKSFLEHVAMVYQVARFVDGNPRAALHDVTGASRATIGRWLTLAEKEHMIRR